VAARQGVEAGGRGRPEGETTMGAAETLDRGPGMVGRQRKRRQAGEPLPPEGELSLQALAGQKLPRQMA